MFLIFVIFLSLIFSVDCRVATEDKYGSNVNMEPDSPTDEDKKPKPEEGTHYQTGSTGVGISKFSTKF